MDEQLPRIESADRISALPDEIIHNHILYHLEAPRQVARTSVLSRRWLQLWRSYPVLEFCEKEERHNTGTGKEYLYDYAGFATASARRLFLYYENCRTPLDSLRISLPENGSWRFRSLLASALASDYGSPLKVVIQTPPRFVFPPDSFSNCSRTKALTLHSRRGLEGLVLQQPMSSLQVLHLKHVKLDDALMLYYFVANAPNLEALSLEECVLGFEKLEISIGNFRRLKTLEIWEPSSSSGYGPVVGPYQLELQLTTAPFLERLIFSEQWKPCKYEAASSSSAPNLKVVRIRTSYYKAAPNRNLNDFISKLPTLEDLEFSLRHYEVTVRDTDLHLITSSTPCLRVLDVFAVRKLSIQTSASSTSRVQVLKLRVPQGFTQGHLDDVISKLPCLESLCLMITDQFKSSDSKMSKMRVSIRQLRAFQLRDCSSAQILVRALEEPTLPELELDAPNLVSVCIDTKFRLPDKVNIVNVPLGCRFVVRGSCLPYDTMSWFLRLKKFLSTLSPFHLVLRWHLTRPRTLFDLSRVECTSRPLIIEHMELEMALFEPPCAQHVRTFLDGLFWACRPKLFSITLDHNLYRVDKFMSKHVVAKCCVGEKCWRHELIDVKIENVSYVDREAIKYFVDLVGIFKVSSPMVQHVKTCSVLIWR